MARVAFTGRGRVCQSERVARAAEPRAGVPFGAAALGSGVMIGAGVFSGLSPAAAEAGWWLLLGVPFAFVTAACCALSTVAQGRSYSGADPAQECTRARMGVLPARVSASARGFGMVVAMAAIARAGAEHLAPRMATLIAPVAVLLVVLVATVGFRLRGEAARWWLMLTAAVLGVVVATCFGIAPATSTVHTATGGFTGTVSAAGMLFFAFLGFEHLCSRGEHVSGRAVRNGLIVSLAVVAGALLLLGFAMLRQLGPERLALSPQPMLDALGAAATGTLRGPVGAAVAIALFPVLFQALQAARAPVRAAVRAGELPGALVRTSAKDTPYLLDVVLGVLAAVVSMLLPAGQAIPLAACCLLVHYALANGSARLLLAGRARRAADLACLGMALSVVLVMSMPVAVLLTTLAVVVLGPLLLTASARLSG